MCRLRRILPILLGMIALVASARGQEVYIASWTLQDPAYSLQSELAVDIIERMNEWLTQDNPEAPTARLDDRLRVTVVGEYNPADGTVQARLQRLNVGGLILDEELGKFLDSVLVKKILLRAYFWREESLTVLDPSLSPQFYQSERQAVRSNAPPTYDKTFAAMTSRNILSLSHLATSVTDRAQIFGGAGHEELGFPGLSYRRFRLGMELGGISGWIEAPLPFSVGPILTGKNQAAAGAGMSFELDRFGGGATWSDAYAVIGMTEDTGYVLTTSALLYGIVPIDYISAADGWLRLKLGAGFLQGTQIIEDTSGVLQPTRTFDYPRLFARAEFVSLNRDGTERRKGALEVFGTSLVASYRQRFSNSFGIEFSGALHGIVGEPPPFTPGASLWFSPVIYLR